MINVGPGTNRVQLESLIVAFAANLRLTEVRGWNVWLNITWQCNVRLRRFSRIYIPASTYVPLVNSHVLVASDKNFSESLLFEFIYTFVVINFARYNIGIFLIDTRSYHLIYVNSFFAWFHIHRNVEKSRFLLCLFPQSVNESITRKLLWRSHHNELTDLIHVL